MDVCTISSMVLYNCCVVPVYKIKKEERKERERERESGEMREDNWHFKFIAQKMSLLETR